MFKKLLIFVLLANAFQPIVICADQVQKSKNTSSFAPTAGVAACTTGALCAAAGYSIAKENPYVAGGLLIASAATPLAVEQLTELSKNKPLTVQELFKLGFADLFTTIGASAVLMYFFPDKSWLKGGLLALCAAKCAYLVWQANHLPSNDLQEESVEGAEKEEKPASTSSNPQGIKPQEAQFIKPIAQTQKPVAPQPAVAVSSTDKSSYPWFGGDKPDHKDAFVLMGN